MNCTQGEKGERDCMLLQTPSGPELGLSPLPFRGACLGSCPPAPLDLSWCTGPLVSLPVRAGWGANLRDFTPLNDMLFVSLISSWGRRYLDLVSSFAEAGKTEEKD